MTIPKKLTYEEVGAFLVAVGQHVIDYDVCAGAVLQDMTEERMKDLIDAMGDALWMEEADLERLELILISLTLEEAISHYYRTS